MDLVPKAEFSIVTRASSKAWIPELIAAAGPEVTETYIDFFTSTIRNRNTRQAYARACWQSFDWCAAHGLELTTVRPFHVSAWIEDFPGSKPTVKQKLAAVRMYAVAQPLAGVTDPKTGLTFPDLNAVTPAAALELTQTNKIQPEPCDFLEGERLPQLLVWLSSGKILSFAASSRTELCTAE